MGISLNPVSGIINAASGVVGKIFGNKEKKDEYDSAGYQSAMQQFATEFQVQNRTWFDSLMDGVNRLPRPAFALGTLALFAYCPINPQHFIEIMNAFTLVPEWLAIFIGSIAAFYFGSRHLEKRLNFKSVDPEKVKLAQAMMNDRQKERDYQKEMADTTKPLSNRAIMEWNARRQQPSK